VKVEGVENVEEEDWIEIKTEEDCIQLVRTVKCEQEVSVLCCVFSGGDLCTGACVRVCCTVHVSCTFFFSSIGHSYLNDRAVYIYIT
jgi:hypothetical protein